MIGAIGPIVAYDGVATMPRVPNAISTIVSSSAFLRPTRSAYAPIQIAPSGRVKKPRPNVATESSRLANASPVGKNALPM
jgi:hypothetical protein